MTSRKTNVFNNYLINLFLSGTVLVFLVAVGCGPINPNSKAPYFSLQTYETEFYEKGTTFELDHDSNKPLVINFWFPSCPPCVKEIPEIDSVYRQYKNKVDVVGVQMIGLDSVSDGSDFVRDSGIGYAVGPDSDGSIAVDYGITGFPTTVFLDSDKNIYKSWQGEIKMEQIKTILETLVETELP